jgi:hypothetical protein
MAGASAENAHVLPDLVAAPPVTPLDPRDLLRDYELAMVSIAERLSMDLAVISNAVGTGQITREQTQILNIHSDRMPINRFQVQPRSAFNVTKSKSS